MSSPSISTSISTPNPDEVEKIASDPKADNPARYGYENEGPGRLGFENEKPAELKPTPTVTIGPNAVYIVDPALASKVEDATEVA